MLFRSDHATPSDSRATLAPVAGLPRSEGRQGRQSCLGGQCVPTVRRKPLSPARPYPPTPRQPTRPQDESKAARVGEAWEGRLACHSEAGRRQGGAAPARPEIHTSPAGQAEADRWLGSFFNQFLGLGLQGQGKSAFSLSGD